MFLKLVTYEKILFACVLIGSIVGFWYFEETSLLKILTIVMAAVGIFFGLSGKTFGKVGSRYELLSLLIIYFGTYSLFNLIYGINLPLYIVMLILLVLVVSLTYSIYTLDTLFHENALVLRPVVILNGLIILEFFLSLYFWPIDPETKSLILVVVFYLINNLVYLYARNMLRLKQVIGYLIVGSLILGLTIVNTWLKMPR